MHLRNIRMLQMHERSKSWCKGAWRSCRSWRYAKPGRVTLLLWSRGRSWFWTPWSREIERRTHWLTMKKRQTVVSQFFQLDRLVVEGGKSVRFPSNRWLIHGIRFTTNIIAGQADRWKKWHNEAERYRVHMRPRTTLEPQLTRNRWDWYENSLVISRLYDN